MQDTSIPDISNNTDFDLSDIFSLLNNMPNVQEESKETKLLNSLKPYLNEKRQKKLAQCEKLMSLTDTLKLLNDMHVFDSFLKNTDE